MSRQTHSWSKGSFRRRCLELRKPAGMALPNFETMQEPGLWPQCPEISYLPSKSFTNGLQNPWHGVSKRRGFCKNFRDGKIDGLPLLGAFACGDVVVCFQHVRAVSLRIAVQCPTREHGQASAVA